MPLSCLYQIGPIWSSKTRLQINIISSSLNDELKFLKTYFDEFLKYLNCRNLNHHGNTLKVCVTIQTKTSTTDAV